MKKLGLILLLVVGSIAGCYAQQGRSSVGMKMGYALDHNNITWGIDYRYNVWENVRFAPNITYMFRNDGVSAWYIDFDGHYVVPVSRNFAFYPIGGFSLSIWDFRGASSNYSRVGVNIGVGCELYATQEISVGLDMKYNLIHNYDQALAALRVAYHF